MISFPKLSVVIAALAIALSVKAQQLSPGLYKRMPPIARHFGRAAEELSLAASMTSRPDRVERHQFASVFGDVAPADFALVTSNSLTGEVKIVFTAVSMALAATPRTPCVAYSLRRDGSGVTRDDGFCRASTELASVYEPRFEAIDEGFLMEWEPSSQLERTDFIPAEHTPTSEEQVACVMGVCSPEAFGRSVSRQLITYFQDRFERRVDLPLVELGRLQTSVDLYRHPGDVVVSAVVPAGRYLAVSEPDGDWVEATSLTDDGSLLRGWMPRLLATPDRWVDQVAMSRLHRFRVAMSGSSDDAAQDTLAIQVIEREGGKTVQWIEGPIGSGDRGPEDEALSLIDANFDGHPDIVMVQADGGAGPNDLKSVYLFDPRSGRYGYDEVLSSLPQIRFDAKSKTVHSASRDGCCSHAHSRWRYVKGALVQVFERDETLTADGRWLEITEGRLVRGRMVYRTWRVKPQWE